MVKIEFDLEKRIEDMKAEEEIRCPHCHELQPNDDYQYPVTYWGEDDPEEWECIECEQKFFVKEEVRRTYTVGKEIDNGYVV